MQQYGEDFLFCQQLTPRDNLLKYYLREKYFAASACPLLACPLPAVPAPQPRSGPC